MADRAIQPYMRSLNLLCWLLYTVWQQERWNLEGEKLKWGYPQLQF